MTQQQSRLLTVLGAFALGLVVCFGAIYLIIGPGIANGALRTVQSGARTAT